MKMPLPALSVAIASLLCSGAVSAADLQLSFYPAGTVWSHPLESARALNGVLLQNTALINRGDKPLTITAIEIDALRDGAASASLRLDASRLEGMAKQGNALAQSGMMQAVDFQFAPEQLLGKDVTVSASRTLAPGAALLVFQQYVAYRGDADRLRVTVRLAEGAEPVIAELAIDNGTAPGAFRFPLQGRWFVGAGASTHSHHRWAVPEEFALDVLRIGEGGVTFRGDGRRMQDYYAYGAPVLASADGEVVKVHDGAADNVKMLRAASESLADYLQRLRAGQDELLAQGTDAIAGNHVVIKHANGVYSVYAHLRPGSLKVAVGDRVRVGQVLAELGGSGNSTEPHLHFHLCNGPDALHCAGLPVAFDNIELPFSDGPRDLQSGDIVEAR